MREVVLRGLAPVATDRFESMRALLDALAAAQARACAPPESRSLPDGFIDFSGERGRHEHFFGRQDVLRELQWHKEMEAVAQVASYIRSLG